MNWRTILTNPSSVLINPPKCIWSDSEIPKQIFNNGKMLVRKNFLFIGVGGHKLSGVSYNPKSNMD